nr:hypothetical protein [Sporomusa silvacetica]
MDEVLQCVVLVTGLHEYTLQIIETLCYKPGCRAVFQYKQNASIPQTCCNCTIIQNVGMIFAINKDVMICKINIKKGDLFDESSSMVW